MGKLPIKHKSMIQVAAVKLDHGWNEYLRLSGQETICKFGLALGPLLAIGGYYNYEIGPFGGTIGVLIFIGCLIRLRAIKECHERRWKEEREINKRLDMIGVHVTHDGKSARMEDGELGSTKEGKGEFLDPLDDFSYG